MEAISDDAITIDEGEKILFSPRMVKRLIYEKCDEEIVSIIEEGCELEDIESLIPQKLWETITALKKTALAKLKLYEVCENGGISKQNVNEIIEEGL